MRPKFDGRLRQLLLGAATMLADAGRGLGRSSRAIFGAIFLLLGMSVAANAQFTVFPLAPGSLPSSIVAGADGALWFTDNNLQKIGRISTAGVVSYTSLPSGSSNPRAIILGPDNALWFAHGGDAHAVGRIDPTTLVITKYVIPPGSLASILTSGPDGNIWFSIKVDSDNFVGRVAVSDGTITIFQNPPAVGRISIAVGEGIATASGDSLLFTGSATDTAQVGKLGRVTTSGVFSLVASDLPPDLKYLQTGPDGALWMATGAGKLGRIATDGGITFFDIGVGYRFPQQGFTSGPDGALWMTSQDDNKVRRVSVGGAITEFSDPAVGLGGMGAITTGPDGNMWFTTGGAGGLAAKIVRLKGSTTTGLQSSGSPSEAGQSVTFTATVTGTAPGTGAPSGTVTFLDGATPLGTGTLSAGSATFATSALAGGGHTITAVYGGGGNFAASTSSALTQTVNKAATTTSLGSSQNPSVFGPSVTFTATVTGAGATGTVTFKIDGVNQNPLGAVSGGTATFTTSSLTAGPHTIVAVYNGDDTYFGSTSPDLIQTVNKGATTTAVSSNHDPSKFGQLVTFTATVNATAPAAGTPGGTVTFKNGGSTLGTRALAGGTASFSTAALAVGNRPITAVYGGNANFAASTSSALPQTVSKGATKTVLTSKPKPSKPGQNVTLTATVTAVAPATGTPTGTVTFKNGSKRLGVRPLAGGKATVKTSALKTGNNKLTAVYGGSAAFTSSASKPLTHPVKESALAVAKLSDGGVVAVWGANDKDGRAGIYVRRYQADGRAAGKDLAVADAQQDRSEPAVAGLKNGSFVVVWTADGLDGSGLGIYGQRYSAAGVKLGAEFRVAQNDQSSSQASTAALNDGGFVVAWASNQEEAESGFGIHAQRYNAAGKPVGGELRVSSASHDQTQPSVAALKDGGFVVAWSSAEAESGNLDILGQRYDTAGGKAGKQFRVNAAKDKNQTDASVAALNDGGFVVAWTSDGGDGSGRGISAQRFTAEGTKLGGEIGVNTTTANDQSEPAVAAFADGGFVVVWNSQGEQATGMQGQAYDAAGNRIDAEFAVNAIASNDPSQPRTAAFSNGNFVVLWTAKDEKSGLPSVQQQRF